MKDPLQDAIEFAEFTISATINSMRLQKRPKTVGVREYWIIDIQKKIITVCEFSTGKPDTIYGFDEDVPGGIFAGNCRIDFTKMLQEIEAWVVE